MNTLLVLGLIVSCVAIVALVLRRGSGDSPGYRRRLPPHPRQRQEPAPDRSPMIWMPLVMPADTQTHYGVDPGCTAAGHVDVDCGSIGGADGGSS